MLTVVDFFTRECVALSSDFSIPGIVVTRALEIAVIERGKFPSSIVIDNDSEFTGKIMDQSVFDNNIKLDFINPGKPQENAFIESFNGRFRDKCLSEHWFLSLEDARRKFSLILALVWGLGHFQIRVRWHYFLER